MSHKDFKFELEESVTITESGETGKVIGRAEYDHGENSYYLRYKDAHGCAKEVWWNQSALECTD